MRKTPGTARRFTRRAPRPSDLLMRLLARIGGWLRAWLARWNPLRRARRVAEQVSRMHFETLEPRLLLSADLMPAAGTALAYGPQQSVTVERSMLDDTASAASGREQLLDVSAGAIGTATVTDADGTVITASINGAGVLELIAQGAGYALNVSGTDRASVLTLTAQGGDGKAVLSAIDVDTPLGQADLAAADLRGNASFAAVGSLSLGDIRNASIGNDIVGDSTLMAGAVTDLRLTAAQAKLAITVASWASSMSGVAPGASFLDTAALKSLIVGGDFSADVRLTGNGITSGFVLDRADVGGVLNHGQWFVVGRANSVQAGSIGGAWRAHFSGNLGQLGSRADMSGVVVAGGLQLLSVGGSLRGATLMLGADLGSDAQLGGSGAAADRFGAGTLARLRVVGDIVDTRVAISLDPVNGVLFDGNDQIVGTAANRIQELTVGGQLLGSTLLVAPALPALVNVAGAVVDPATLPQLSISPADAVLPQLSAQLANDTGASAGDGITRDAGLVARVVDVGGVAALRGRIGAGSLQNLAYTVQADGSLLVSAAGLAAINGGSLADGDYSVELRAADFAGNLSNPSTVVFTLDTNAPASSIGLAPASDTGTQGDNITTAATVVIQGSTEPGSSVALTAPALSTTAAADGSFSFANLALSLGNNDFAFTLTDVAGNAAAASLRIRRDDTTAADATPPTLSAALAADTGASASDGLTNNPAVAGQASDNVAVNQLRAVLDPGATPSFTNITASLTANGSFALNRALLDTLAGGTLAEGAHTLRLVAVDAAANEATVNVAFTLDTVAPASVVSFGLSAADASNAALDETSAGTVQLKGVAQQGATVTLASQGLSAVAGVGGAFVLPGVVLGLGANPLVLNTVDAAGNVGTTPLSRTITRTAAVQTDAVLVWNDIALRAVQLDVTDPPVATRTLAMVSLAQYDALAAIEGTPAYLVQRSVSGPTSAQAAVAVAAHRILSLTYPAQAALFDSALATSLAGIADGVAKDNGILLGLSVADAVRAARANDGYQNYMDYVGSTTPGLWRPTGPMFDVPEAPHWGTLQPFALSSADEFRPPAPPALDSAAYAADVNEIKLLGSATGSTRTADQTEQAQFWADGKGSTTPPGHWNQIAAEVAAAQGNSLSANARLFAQLNVALADAAIACWDAKYTYSLWRPETAIQNADLDNNAATAVDAAWRPLMISPAHPEYVSGHSTFSRAAATVLAAAFGDQTAFSTTSATLPGVTRSFTSFSDAADESGRSRVYGGIHFEFSNQAAQVLGAQVAQAVLQRFALTDDTQAPTVALNATAAAVNTNLTLTGQVLDNLSGVAAAQFRLDGGALQDLALDANGNFSITTALATDGSADGQHTLSVLARDVAGNLSAGYNRGFTLDTSAPTITLSSIANGDALVAGSRLSGAAAVEGSALTLLSYRFDSGTTRSISFGGNGSFDQLLTLGNLAVGDHTLTLDARDAAGNTASLTRNVTVQALAPFTLGTVTPPLGAGNIGVTQRPLINFSRAVNPATLTADSLYATAPDGSKLAATIVPALDASFAWLFFTNPMPGGAQITLHIDGSKIRAAADGSFLDADGDGTAGGVFTRSFTTVSSTAVVGTKLVGKVVDPGADLEPGTFDDVRRGPDGIIHTADDVFLNPIAHAKVFVLGQESSFVYTDANGNFELDGVPAGSVKVAIDGRTATNAPAGTFFPEMVMAVELRAGVTNTLMGSMGSQTERLANLDRVEVYLPRVASSVLQPVSDTVPTVITVQDAAAAPALTDEQRQSLTLTVTPGSLVGENGQVLSNVQIGIATVPPELVRDMLPPGVLQHTFDITIQAPGVATFAQPVQITFPNVFNAAPGTQLNILSFDHTTGRLVINGTGTVSADGKTVVSDEGSGVRAPGWHGVAPPGPTGRRDTPRRPNPPPPPPPFPPPPNPPLPPAPPVIPTPIAPPVPQPPPVVVIVVPPVPTPPPPPPVVVIVPGFGNTPIFNIDLTLPSAGLTPTQRLTIQAEAQAWSRIIVNDLPADLTSIGLVDDLHIIFDVAPIDGAGGTYGDTNLLDVRTGALKLPSLAKVTLDPADLATLSAEQFRALVRHEIAHALGFGELWGSLGLVDTSVAGNPRFNGSNAIAAYAALTGAVQTGVPIDNRAGANATHWREIVFGNELMTPLLDPSGPYPLSALSIAALRDMGYVVQPALADTYALPGPTFLFHPNATTPANSGNGELLDATGGGVSAGQVASAPAPTATDHLFFAFDFGGASSPLATGFGRVSSTTTYSAATGYGWQAGSAVTDRQTSTDPLAALTADFAETRDASFRVDLPNGTYEVLATFGDDASARNGTTYDIEGARRGQVSTPDGQHVTLTHRVEVVDGQMNLRFMGGGTPVALNALEIHQVSDYVTLPSNVDYTSGRFYLAIMNMDTGFVLRDTVDVTPGAALCIDGVVLSPNTAYRQYVYQVDTNTIGISEFVTPASGVTFDLPEVIMGGRYTADSDGDGLEDLAEFIVNTRADRADTDNDGIPDRAELQQGLDPLGGLSVPSGVIAGQALQGTAQAIAVATDPDNINKLTAYVATGSFGLAVVDVSQFTRPQLLAELNLPGTAVDVAVDVQRNRVMVATAEAGLQIVDVSNRAAPVLVDTVAFGQAVNQVEVRDGLAFVAAGNALAVVDVNTGELRQTIELGNSGGTNIVALAVDGSGVFTIDANNTLRSFSLAGGIVAPADTLALPGTARSLFVGDGVAYVGAESSFLAGYLTVDVSDIGDVSLISGADDPGIAGRAIVLNGSGLGIAVGAPGRGGNVLDVVDTRDPADTGAFVARFNLPSAPNDVVLSSGIAYVAGGTSGLQVVNFAGFDSLGVAPTVTIAVQGVDVDPVTPGIQVIEGRSVRVVPTVGDDVQVRSVELLVNGTVVTTDSAFPFELFASAPLLSAGGNTMLLQVRATDTGGNVTLSNIASIGVVADTFAPNVTSVSIADGDRRFFVRSIDLRFDEPLNAAAVSTAGLSLVRLGVGGAPDTAVALSFDIRTLGQVLQLLPAGILPPGDYRLRVDPSVIRDAAGNALAAPIERSFSIRPASDVRATSGVPDIPTAPSANPGQQIGIAVPFDPSTARAQFSVIDANGNITTRVINVLRFDAGSSTAFFTVPIDATTADAVVYSQVGAVRTDFADGTFPLQILPIVTTVDVESVSADGSTAQVLISGLGFAEGNNSEYRIGSETVLDGGNAIGPDVFGRSDAVLGFVANGYARVTVPLSDGAFGAISVKTGGGTSASYSVDISGITSVALSGTPANAALGSANAGQAITVQGTGLNTGSDFILGYSDIGGVSRAVVLQPTAAAADGSSATLVIPEYANGAPKLRLFGSGSSPVLQIVPTLSGYDVQDRLVLFGSGLIEGQGEYSIGGVQLSDSAGDANVDVYYSAGFTYENGSVYLDRTALPVHGLGTARVSTAGGTSAALDLGVLRLNVAGTSLGDVAVNAQGELWVSDYANPGKLTRIDAANGQTLSVIDMTAAFGTAYTYNLAGLQVLDSAMTLNNVSVAAGSLLVFNGYTNPDRVIALNPTSGAVIASLVLAGNYDLTAGVYDAATGKLFVTESNGAGNRLLKLNAQTGALEEAITVPLNISSWAGLAIDPTSGNLWLGSTQGNEVVEVTRAGVEVRRVNLAAQGVNQNEISGLAFDAAGQLFVASTQGVVYRVDTDKDVAAVAAPTLSQIIGRTTSGVAADAGQAAGNVGEVIELVGSRFGEGTRVLFATRDSAGNVGTVSVAPLVINGAGTRLQVLVPDSATTGDVRVVNQGTRNLGGSGSVDAAYRNVSVQFTAGGADATVRFTDGGLEDISNESWGLDNVRVFQGVGQGGTLVFADDFESGNASANWSDARVDSAAAGSFSRYSGRFASESQTLNLSGLSAGQSYTLSFDLYILDSWEGDSGPDLIDVSVDGTSVLRESFSNVGNVASSANVQSFGTSAPQRLQIVPTLTATANGRPGDTNPFNLIGSGFMEGASTLSIGGVVLNDNQGNTTPFDVTGTRNSNYSVLAPLGLDGPIRVTTEGGYAEIPAPSIPAQPLSQFTAIVAKADTGQPLDATRPSATTGQTIVLQGQGFTSATLVRFQGVSDSGTLGTLTRSGSVGAGGTTLSVIVPALARSGEVTVLGSGNTVNGQFVPSSVELQIVPTITAVGGSLTPGNSVLISGSGLSVNDLVVSIGGRTAGNFSVRTVVDGANNTPDMQLLSVVVPAGASGNDIVISTAGGSASARIGASLAAQTPLAPAGDVGNTLASALVLGLGVDRQQTINSDIGGALAGLDVDLYRIELVGGDALSFNLSGLSSRLRLFDAAGTQLTAQNFAVSGTAALRYVPTSGGTYYVGISGSGNTNYDPNVQGSGNNSVTGSYTLGIERQGAGSTRLASISASAASGTAANGALASANTGQTITLNGNSSGSGIQAGERVVFTTLDTNGNLGQVIVVGSIDLVNQTVSVVVPDNATTGGVRLERDGESSGVLLQIVPTLSDVNMSAGSAYIGGTLVLSGSGFAEGTSAVSFGAQRVDDIGTSYGLDVYGTNNRLNIVVPVTTPALPVGPIRVSTLGGTSAAFGLSLTSISASAAGTPADPAQASAVPGQIVTLNGSLFDATMDVVFEVIDQGGNRSDRVVRPTTVNAAGTQAQVVVPLDAASGQVRLLGDINAQAITLQIVPLIRDIQVESVAADGLSAQVLISGLGFIEGGNSEYRFGNQIVLDAGASTGPDVFGRSDAVLGFVANGYARVTVPLSDGAFGAISVKTGGGTSASYSVDISGITSVALSGTPANAALGSANAGQAITVQGTGLNTGSDFILGYSDIGGVSRAVVLQPTAAAADGSSATLVIPEYANGAPKLRLFGSGSSPVLQIVPTLSGYDVQDRLVLFGSGLIEGQGEYSIGGVQLSDSAGDANVDVYYSAGFTYENGSVYLDRTALPVHGLGTARVSTAGGTSAALDLGVLRLNVAGTSLGDVAVNAQGELWVSDYANPGKLTRIDAANGQTLSVIDMTAAFGTAYTYNLAGLQVLDSAMTLNNVSVAAGSLLVFNGYTNPDRVIALNPTSGAVIASLVLAGNYDLTAGVYDAATGKLFVTESNGAGNRLLKLNAQTGALEEAITVPLNISSWAGLAIDPTSGNLWLGSTQGNEVVEVTRAGVEVRRVNLAAQGVNQNEISGLAFDAAGQLFVASTQGVVYRVDVS